MTRRDRSDALPLLLLCSVVMLGATLAAGEPSLLRTLLAVWFLLACPGLALAPLTDLRDAFGIATVAITLSIAIDTIVAAGLLYCGAWSAIAGYAILAAITVAGASRQLATRSGEQR